MTYRTLLYVATTFALVLLLAYTLLTYATPAYVCAASAIEGVGCP